MRATTWCFVILVILPVCGCNSPSLSAPETSTLRAVEVVEVRFVPIHRTLTLIGKCEPSREATLYFEVGGVVAEVAVEDAATVAAGDVIATLVPDDYQLAVEQAEAQRQKAQAELSLLRAGTRKEEIEAARADYDRSRSRSSYWVHELKRVTSISQTGAIADEELQRVQSEHDAATHQERADMARWQRAVAGPRPEEIAAAAAHLKASEQAVGIARRQLAKATLRSPFRGRVERRFVDEGAYINLFPKGGSPIVHIADWNQVDAVLSVPEVFHRQLSGVTSVEVISAVDPEIRADARVVSLGKVADPATGTYPLRVRLSNSTGHLTGGMIVEAAVDASADREAICVPVTAIRKAYGQSPQLLLVDAQGQQVVLRNVQLGEIMGDQVEITAGLEPRDRVIVRGQDRVVEGDRVRIVP